MLSTSTLMRPMQNKFRNKKERFSERVPHSGNNILTENDKDADVFDMENGQGENYEGRQT